MAAEPSFVPVSMPPAYNSSAPGAAPAAWHDPMNVSTYPGGYAFFMPVVIPITYHLQPDPPQQQPPAQRQEPPRKVPPKDALKEVPQKEPLKRTTSTASGVERVTMKVPRSKLTAKNQSIVSLTFPLVVTGVNVAFKIVITAGKQNDNFYNAKGWGRLALKCEGTPSQPSLITFRFLVGAGDLKQPARGQVTHDFSSGAVCGLPEDCDKDWNLLAAVDRATGHVPVVLEVVLIRHLDAADQKVLERRW